MKILVVYAYGQSPMRASLRDHLYSFREYSNNSVFFLNLAFKKIPLYLKKIRFDLVIFHTLFASNHWGGETHFRELMKKVEAVKGMPCPKILLPQDEFINSDILASFIDEFGICKVFTVCPLEIIPVVYRNVISKSVTYERILTGYIDGRMIKRVKKLSRTLKRRTIDIGYRASGIPQAWWGRLGYLKKTFADSVCKDSSAGKLRLDISISGKDTLIGDAWLRHLLNCRYTIGSESGTSIIDNDGSVRDQTNAYLKNHPGASFQEIEASCFPGRDGIYKLNAISPRHFEACITKTCQILVEGEYNGILEPGVHYIPVKKDLSNLHEVLEGLGDEDFRIKIVERAYRDIVESGHYTYQAMVETVLGEFEKQIEAKREGPSVYLALSVNRIWEFFEDIVWTRPRTMFIELLRRIKHFIVK